MIQKIKKHILIIASMIMISAPAIAPAVASAAVSGCGNIGGEVASGANAAVPNNGGGNISSCNSNDTTGAQSELGKLAQNIVNIFSYVVGAIAIIMIIYGGFRYVTSGGDQNAVGSAKNTLIYAIVGLIIVALAQIIVHFVLNQTSAVS